MIHPSFSTKAFRIGTVGISAWKHGVVFGSGGGGFLGSSSGGSSSGSSSLLLLRAFSIGRTGTVMRLNGRQQWRGIKQSSTHNNEKEKVVKSQQTLLQRFLGHKEIPPRGTLLWYREMFLICTVFAITGSATMFLVRPAMTNILGLRGSLWDGPWSYRICSIVIMTPLYSILLVCVGTVFGRHFYFRHFAVRMFSRFGIPPELMDETFHETAKKFRKW